MLCRLPGPPDYYVRLPGCFYFIFSNTSANKDCEMCGTVEILWLVSRWFVSRPDITQMVDWVLIVIMYYLHICLSIYLSIYLSFCLSIYLSNYLSNYQFSSVQDGIYALGKAHMRSTPSLGSFLNVAFENSPNVGLIDDGLFSSSQGRSLSASSSYASLFQAIYGVMSLALCPQVVS